MLNKRKSDKPLDMVDVTIAALTLVGWFIVVAMNSPVTDSSFGYSRVFGVNFAVYAILSTLVFFILLPLVRKMVSPRWPWDIVIGVVVATILGFIAYYAIGLAIFRLT